MSMKFTWLLHPLCVLSLDYLPCVITGHLQKFYMSHLCMIISKNRNVTFLFHLYFRSEKTFPRSSLEVLPLPFTCGWPELYYMSMSKPIAREGNVVTWLLWTSQNVMKPVPKVHGQVKNDGFWSTAGTRMWARAGARVVLEWEEWGRLGGGQCWKSEQASQKQQEEKAVEQPTEKTCWLPLLRIFATKNGYHHAPGEFSYCPPSCKSTREWMQPRKKWLI